MLSDIGGGLTTFNSLVKQNVIAPVEVIFNKAENKNPIESHVKPE
jgi:hypothetical protein